MNVGSTGSQGIDPSTWEHPEMRQALAQRDIATVYRLLQRVGVSQRRIGALTGQAQSEVGAILKGRQVMAYDVLVRISQGLGAPRAYMGLAHDSETEISRSLTLGEGQESEARREALARAAEVTIGAAVVSATDWCQPVDGVASPVPARIGLADVAQLDAITRSLRALDQQFGGGVCRDAVLAQVRWSQQLLRSGCSADVGQRLHLALADLHNLAGWTSFDIGLHRPARAHFTRALEQAKHADEPSLVAKVLYCMGRLHLHNGWTSDALKFFQLAQIAAQDAGCELTVAMLCANEAWAYALLGDDVQAHKSVGRAEDEFARADPKTAAAWAQFFGSADLHASVGMVHAVLPDPTPRRLDQAVKGFTRSLSLRGLTTTRSRTFELTALATVHLQAGDLDHGAQVGHSAIDLVERLRSMRVVDRLAPLGREAERHRQHPDVRDLADRIATVRPAA